MSPPRAPTIRRLPAATGGGMLRVLASYLNMDAAAKLRPHPPRVSPKIGCVFCLIPISSEQSYESMALLANALAVILAAPVVKDNDRVLAAMHSDDHTVRTKTAGSTGAVAFSGGSAPGTLLGYSAVKALDSIGALHNSTMIGSVSGGTLGYALFVTKPDVVIPDAQARHWTLDDLKQWRATNGIGFDSSALALSFSFTHGQLMPCVKSIVTSRSFNTTECQPYQGLSTHLATCVGSECVAHTVNERYLLHRARHTPLVTARHHLVARIGSDMLPSSIRDRPAC